MNRPRERPDGYHTAMTRSPTKAVADQTTGLVTGNILTCRCDATPPFSTDPPAFPFSIRSASLRPSPSHILPSPRPPLPTFLQASLPSPLSSRQTFYPSISLILLPSSREGRGEERGRRVGGTEGEKTRRSPSAIQGKDTDGFGD